MQAQALRLGNGASSLDALRSLLEQFRLLTVMLGLIFGDLNLSASGESVVSALRGIALLDSQEIVNCYHG